MGLPSVSTVSRCDTETKFVGGINGSVVQKSAKLYDGNLVIEASDEARVRR